MDANTITAIAALVAAIGSLVAAVTGRSNATKITNVHDELRVSNGKTMGKLAEMTEGRRIESDVAPADRTSADQHYVDDLTPPDDEH